MANYRLNLDDTISELNCVFPCPSRFPGGSNKASLIEYREITAGKVIYRLREPNNLQLEVTLMCSPLDQIQSLRDSSSLHPYVVLGSKEFNFDFVPFSDVIVNSEARYVAFPRSLYDRISSPTVLNGIC